MSRSTIVIATALAFAATLASAPAQAQRDRVFVASYGTDTNNTLCSFTQPCRTFQNAINNVAVNGEVTAIDSAGFQPMTITQSVTITSPAGVEAGIQAAPDGDAIDINAPGATVVLRGLTLDGAGVANHGINFEAGASLTVTDCVVQNFSSSASSYGILMRPSSGTIGFVITNTIVSNNTLGIAYNLAGLSGGSAIATGVIDHVVAANNLNGIEINNYGGGLTTVAISNSIASNNSGFGIYIGSNSSAMLAVSIDNTGISGNEYGIELFIKSNVTLGRSVITANSNDGIANETNPNSFYSYQNNRINGNATSGTGLDITVAPLSLA